MYMWVGLTTWKLITYQVLISETTYPFSLRRHGLAVAFHEEVEPREMFLTNVDMLTGCFCAGLVWTIKIVEILWEQFSCLV